MFFVNAKRVGVRWSNWAGSECSRVAEVCEPVDAVQLREAVCSARERGLTVKAIGASHSFSGIGATTGMRISTERLRGLVSADVQRARVTLFAGTHLYELPEILGPLGLALPNMGDVNLQSVAGATQTGTHGTGLGFQGLANCVVGATVVDGRGELVTIDEDHNAELLPALAVGLGALGVLVTVTLQLVPRFLLRAREFPNSFTGELSAFVERSRVSDHYEFFWFPHSASVRVKVNTRLPFGEGVRPLGPVAKFLDEELANNFAFGAVCALGWVLPGTVPYVTRFVSGVSSRRSYVDESHRVYVTKRRVRFHETEYALPLERVPDVLRDLKRMIERGKHVVSFPVEVRASAADNLFLSMAAGRETGYVAVHRYHREKDRSFFVAAEKIFAEYGGRPHWGKMHTRDAAYLREQYPFFDDFLAVRDRLDPDRVFANPYLDRVLGV